RRPGGAPVCCSLTATRSASPTSLIVDPLPQTSRYDGTHPDGPAAPNVRGFSIRRTPARSLDRRPDVLIHPEQVGRIVFLLEHGKASVVFAIGRPHTRLALVVHHEIGISSAGVEAMQRLPIVSGPACYRCGLLRVRIDSGNDHRPCRISGAPRRFMLADAMNGAIDGIKVH